MKAGKYSLKELFLNRYIDQIVIPEIQRDYVWKEQQLNGLMNSIKNDFEKFTNASTPIELDNKELEQAFKDFYIKRNYASNIGFIYAYNDAQYSGKYFLIDGQQRLTSLFLLSAVLANRNISLRDDFRKQFMVNNTPKLDYRIREASQDFSFKFINFIIGGGQDIENQNWYYDAYKNDATIFNLVENYKAVHTFFDVNAVDEHGFYAYIQDYVEFWYFDTNVSEQGEELYIYMNARGEQMQSNENIKAELLGRLPTIEDKNRYGLKWEEWQDFFWIHKGDNKNADFGFNEFLACISGLEHYKKSNRHIFYNTEKFDLYKGIQVHEIIATLDLEIIERYMDCLIYLVENRIAFKKHYSYSSWVDVSIQEIWSILNKSKMNWYADYTDPNKGNEQNKMIFLWSVLLFFTKRSHEQLLFKNEMFRVLRIYHIRYNNYDRSVVNILSNIDNFCNYGPWKAPVTSEENYKHTLYNSVKAEQVIHFEELIWKIEDHKYNLSAIGLGGINVSHLVDFQQPITLRNLELIRDRFYEIFPENERNHHDMQSILLYYGAFWYRVTPHYYSNYRFDDWKKIIRGIKENAEERKAFSLFFKEFAGYSGTLKELLQNKRASQISIEKCEDFKDRLLYYNQHLEHGMWSQGNHIAFSNGSYCGLPNYTKKDKTFKDHYELFNIKGDLKGGDPKSLYQLLPKEIKQLAL